MSLMRRLAAAAVIMAGSVGAAAAEQITVTHWGALFYGVPYAVAMDKGWFKEEGGDITGILTSTGGGTSVRNTLAGGMPYGEVALPAAIEAINAGEKLLIVNSAVETAADIGFAAVKGSPLKGIQSLKGKKVAYTRPGSVSEMLILMALDSAGMKRSDVQLVAGGGAGALLTAILQGAVDAGNVADPMWTQNEQKLEMVFWIKDVMNPKMTQTVGITTPEFAASNPEKIQAIIKARMRAVRFIKEQPEAAGDITAKAYNTDPVILRKIARRFVEFGYWGEGAFDFEAMDRMVEGLKIVGKMKDRMDWNPIVTDKFLPAELKAKSS